MTKTAFKIALALAMMGPCATMLSAQGTRVKSEGPDVILGILDNTQVYARNNGIAALAATTISCNAGNKVVNWIRLPDNRHPVISLNLYRFLDGRMQQIGQSWVKHGFLALQNDFCGFGCKPNSSNQGLGVGCSDPYDAEINQGPSLGARSEINPTTGYFNGNTANRHNGQSQSTGIEHGLQVDEADMGLPNARYFIEGQYITADDAAAGNSLNNTSYREVAIKRALSGDWIFENRGLTVRQKSALEAWREDGATINQVDAVEAQVGGKDFKSRIVVAYRVRAVTSTKNRYEYAIYNMNSEQAIRSFSIRVGNTPITNIGFSSVRSHEEAWSNDPWTSRVADGLVSWSTKQFSEDANANAIRWGTTYNFWFDADAPPVDKGASLERFKQGSAGPITITVKGPQ